VASCESRVHILSQFELEFLFNESIYLPTEGILHEESLEIFYIGYICNDKK
jgi:hypothetical protein